MHGVVQRLCQIVPADCSDGDAADSILGYVTGFMLVEGSSKDDVRTLLESVLGNLPDLVNQEGHSN
jgi:hypothetical protein